MIILTYQNQADQTNSATNIHMPADLFYLMISISSPGFIQPAVIILEKMPSLGITQSPVFSRMAQPKWHSLPI
jgi:hypothetical protein